MKQFKQSSGIFQMVGRILFFPLSLNIWGVQFPFEFGLGVFISAGLLMIISFFAGFYGLLIRGSWMMPPWFCAAPLLLVFVAGLLSGRRTWQWIKEYLGFEPKTLYQPGTNAQFSDKEKGWIRYIGYIVLGISISSFLTWYWWIMPLSYDQLQVRGDIGPFFSFFRTWMRFILPYANSGWLYVFKWTLVVIVFLDFLPFSRTVMRRTRLPGFVAFDITVVWLIMMSVWWYNTYLPTF